MKYNFTLYSIQYGNGMIWHIECTTTAYSYEEAFQNFKSNMSGRTGTEFIITFTP